MKKLVATSFVVLCFLSPSKALPPTPSHVILARVCVHEAGFASDRSGDCDGIYSVLHRVGRGDVIRGAYQYSVRAMTGRTTRPWVAYLEEDGRVPTLWPRWLSWKNHRDSWLRVVAHAKSLTTHEEWPACLPEHWGARYGVDLDRAKRFRWREVDCGETKNAFWARQ